MCMIRVRIYACVLRSVSSRAASCTCVYVHDTRTHICMCTAQRELEGRKLHLSVYVHVTYTCMGMRACVCERLHACGGLLGGKRHHAHLLQLPLTYAGMHVRIRAYVCMCSRLTYGRAHVLTYLTRPYLPRPYLPRPYLPRPYLPSPYLPRPYLPRPSRPTATVSSSAPPPTK